MAPLPIAQATGVRHTIADALNAAGLPGYAVVPRTISLPACIVIPDEPYLRPNRVGPALNAEIRFVIGCIAQAVDNEAAVATCEALAEGVIAALPDGVRAVRVGRPTLESLGAQGNAYIAEVEVVAQVSGPAVIPRMPAPAPTPEPGSDEPRNLSHDTADNPDVELDVDPTK